MDFLLGVPAKLKTLTDRLTATRAGYLDNLTNCDAPISTVDANVDAILVDTGTTLPATLATIDGVVDAILVDTGTTLPATLTTLDGKVDTVDTNIDTLLARLTAARAGYLDSLGTGVGIKSVQRGWSTPSGSSPLNITITAVDTTKCFTTCTSNISGWGSSGYVRLTSSTNLQISNYYYSDPSYYGVATAWEVVEFY